MRCKVGDLAVIVRSAAGNEGRIVRCVRLLGMTKLRAPTGAIFEAVCWEIDQVLIGCHGNRTNRVPDNSLRPIRDNDGQDETLTWKERETA